MPYFSFATGNQLRPGRRPFTRLDGTEVTVPLMENRELGGPAVVTDDYAATELPYADAALSMLVVVPAEGRYEAVEADLDSELVATIDAAAAPSSVTLALPRFESTTTIDLRDATTALGFDESGARPSAIEVRAEPAVS